VLLARFCQVNKHLAANASPGSEVTTNNQRSTTSDYTTASTL
jgi:hypothetical protein